jgi:hypothetical protein
MGAEEGEREGWREGETRRAATRRRGEVAKICFRFF